MPRSPTRVSTAASGAKCHLRFRSRRLLVIAFGFLASLGPALAHAQTQPPVPPLREAAASGLEAQPAEFIEALKSLKQRMEILEEEHLQESNTAEATLAKEAPAENASKQKWAPKLGGQVFADYGNWAGASPPIRDTGQDFMNWRRVRFQVDGDGYGVFDYRVQLDFEPDNDSSNGVTEPYVAMKDVFVGIKGVHRNTRVRFGNFFVPFSLEQLTSVANTTFMERSIPTAGIFSPGREVGVATYHISKDQNKTLAFGLFFDDIPESTKEWVDDNQGIRLSSRGSWLPYYDEKRNGRYLLHTGAGLIYTDDRDDSVRFRSRPGEIRETQRLMDTGDIAADAYSVANLELASVAGPLSLQSEMVVTTVSRIGGDDVRLYGAYLQGSYFLTGESRKYDRDGRHGAHFGRVTPNSTFSLRPGSVGWGAWEVKARWAYLDFGELQRGHYNELTLGMNWYWHESARALFEWIHPWTSSEAAVGNRLIGRTEADLLAMRLQFTF